MKNQKGLTLTALMVSIVILFILLGVTINSTIKDGGLFDTTKKAANVTEEKIQYEAETLPSEMDKYIESLDL